MNSDENRKTMKRTITILLLFLSLQMSAQCWQSISAGYDHSLAIKNDGTLWAWGRNDYSQLGDGTTANKNTPTQIGTANNWVKISTSLRTSYAIKADGTLWSWGRNQYGQLGQGAEAIITTPTQVGTATNWQNINAGEEHFIALKTDGTLWGSGRNHYGQLGDNTSVNKSTPIQLSTANWQEIATKNDHNLAIKTDGTLWSWGYNANGELGLGYVIVSLNSITQVGTDTNWQKISSNGYHSVAIKTDGTLWAWGANSGSQLGNGTTTDRTSPEQIGVSTDWQKIAAGRSFTYAIKTDGTLWSWGEGLYGELGNGVSAQIKSRPTQVGTSSDNSDVSAGAEHVLVKNTANFIKSTGRNNYGQLGDETNVDKNSFNSILCYSSTLSIEDFAINELKVYPNPVTDLLNLSFDKEITAVSIYNLLGQKVATKNINNNENSIDVSHLTSGTYLIKVISGVGVKTLKIIKE